MSFLDLAFIENDKLISQMIDEKTKEQKNKNQDLDFFDNSTVIAQNSPIDRFMLKSISTTLK